MTTLIYLFIQSFSNVSSQKISFARILSISALVSLLHPFLFYDIVPASAKPATDEALRKTQELQMPFIANEGQTDERVRFYANTAGGTVFVIKDGEIVYVLPKYEEKAKDVHHEAHEENTNVGRRDSSLLTYSNKSMEYGCNLAERGMAAWGQDENNPLNPPLSRGTKCEIRNPKSTGGVMLKEEIVGGRISTVKGEGESFTKISYFKGNDPSKWKNNITTYDMVDLGEIYKGVELKLQAHGNNVEKLFYVKPGADPNQIKISLSGLQSPECNEKLPPESPFIKGDFLSPAIQAVQTGVGRRWMHPIESRDITKSPLEKGARGLSVNEDGQLVAETALGLVKFTKPIAYQMIDGKRVEVECEYVIAECGGICPQNTQKDTKMDFLRPFESFRGLSELLYPKSKFQNVNSEFQDMKSEIQNLKSEYGFKVASYDTTKELIIDPLLASTFLGRGSFQHHSIAIDQHGNVYVAGSTYAPDFPTTSGVYDTSLGGSYDIFVSKLNGELTKLLASTYLGGTAANSLLVTEEIRSLAIDPDENIFVSGFTRSQDFPVTPGAYDTSFTSEPGIFISKLDKNLTKLLASTFFDEGVWGGSGGVIVIDKNGDVYVTGTTSSPNFPTTPGAFDTSINDSNYANASDAFVSKLKGDLTTLLVSTYLGGSNRDDGHSITIDSNGDVYVIGYTESSDFPVTPDAYNTTPGRIFVSKLNGDLTKLLASTIFGGNDSYLFYPTIALDLNGNVFVAGNVSSGGGNELPNFPTTPNAYDTSYNDFWDIFISKFSGDLKNLLASTYLGGTESDGAYTVAIAPDANGNIYITGDTFSIDFPTYEEPYHGDGYSADAFVSKLSGDLTELLESTNLGGTDWDLGSAIAMDTKGYVYVTGMTQSSDFPTTPGAYDTSPAKFDRDTRTFVTRFINTLHYCADELSISGISPKTGGNNGFVSALINGCQFQEGAKVKLVKDDQPAVWGDIVKLKNANYITTIFNLSGKETGLWDVVVVNPDGSSAILSEGFTVVEGKSPQVWVDVLARSFFRINRENKISILYGNNGNTDALGVPLWIAGIPKDATWKPCFNITPPPQREDEEPIDWSEAPIYIEREKDIVIPLFLPVIRQGRKGMIEIKMTVPTSRTIQPQVWVNPPYFNLPQDSQDLSGPSIGEDAANCTVQIAQFAAMKAAEKLLDAVMPTECLKAVAGAGLDSYTIVLANELHDLHGNDNIQSAELLITDAVRVGLECTKSAAKYIPVVKIALAVKDAIDLGLEIQDMYSTCEKVGARVYEKFANVNVVGSADPNMKVGSNGVGNLHYITASEPLRYVVYFENKEDATAPAQEVVITDQLDTTKVDLHTFSLGVMTFGTTTVEPEPGLSEYTTDVDLRPANNLVVRINANLNMDTGVITWRFISLDPETGEPTEDPLAGFLPPNKTPPEGEGNVIFTIMPKNDLSTSTKISNGAKIVFDMNQPIVTNEWTNTIDKTKPESNILTLSDTQASPTFTVQWSGTDEGSGIRDYTIFVSEDGGPFTEWLIDTTETSGVFSGKPGSHYAFYSIAHDNVFNHEDAPSEIDTTTMVVLENVEDCANGTDDDNDGLIDCNDPDCLSHKACHTEDCKNGLDDDGDGYTDCNDPDCIGEDCHISPVVKTTSATNVKTKSATLNGTINANDLAADVWFEYSTENGSYGNTTATQNVNVSDEVKINTEVNGLTPGKTYYFRIVAKTSIETVYGDEMSFTTSAAKNGKVAGKVIDESGIPMDAVKIKLKGKGVKKAKTATSNVKGAFVFKGISSGNYTIIATKEGYKNKKKKIKLDAGANKKVTIKMKKTAQNEISVEDLQDEASDE